MVLIWSNFLLKYLYLVGPFLVTIIRFQVSTQVFVHREMENDTDTQNYIYIYIYIYIYFNKELLAVFLCYW